MDYQNNGGLCDGIRLSIAKLVADGRTTLEKSFGQQFQGPPIFFVPLFDYMHKDRVNTSSVWIEHVERQMLRLCTSCGKRVIRRLTGCRF